MPVMTAKMATQTQKRKKKGSSYPRGEDREWIPGIDSQPVYVCLGGGGGGRGDKGWWSALFSQVYTEVVKTSTTNTIHLNSVEHKAGEAYHTHYPFVYLLE